MLYLFVIGMKLLTAKGISLSVNSMVIP